MKSFSVPYHLSSSTI